MVNSIVLALDGDGIIHCLMGALPHPDVSMIIGQKSQFFAHRRTQLSLLSRHGWNILTHWGQWWL
jgi:hypothetical protein